MKKIIGFLSVLFLTYWLIRPLFVSGYFPMHDDTQVARVIVMGRALRDGQFPVRWVSDLGYGYGYPIYNFYGPLPYYFGGTLYAAGMDSVAATKMMFATGIVLASVMMYFVLLRPFGVSGAILGSTLFGYAPYHAVDIYVRGAVGEYWAIAFLPLVLFGFISSIRDTSVKSSIVGIIGLSGVIVSHTLLGYITVGILCVGYGITLIVLASRKQPVILRFVHALILLGFGLGTSAFFWLPALLEMPYTGVSAMISQASTGFFDHFVCFAQLWDSPWGFGGSAPGCIDGMSYKLGKLHIIVVLFGLLVWFISRKKQKSIVASLFTDISIALFGISIIAVLPLSSAFWSYVPFHSFLQYPWRLLSYTVVCMSIVGLYPLTVISKQNFRLLYAGVVIIFCVLINGKLFQPKYLYPVDSHLLETKEDISYRVSKISDEYLSVGIPRPDSPADLFQTPIIGKEPVKIRIITDSSIVLKAEVESSSEQWLQIQKAYFPGWKYTVNGRQIQPKIAQDLPSVLVSEGKSVIEVRLTNTPVRTIANTVSLCTLLIMAYLLYYDKKTNS